MREELDIITAYQKVGTYRGAADMCGTTHKTVKRIVERHAAGQARPVRAPRLANYEAVLASDSFYKALRNTFSIFLLSSVPQVVAAILIAYVLDANLRAKTFWRMSVLLPYVVTPVAVTLIFSSAFDEKYGLINNMLQAIGLDPVMWKTETFPSHVAIATASASPLGTMA